MPQGDIKQTFKSNQFRHEEPTPNELMTVEFRPNDPTDLSDNPLRMWARTDTGDLWYTVDGVNINSAAKRGDLPFVNAEWYGAKGNGTTINTLAFQSAMTDLSSAGGGLLFIPEGVFVGTIKVPSNCGVIGSCRKSVIKVPNNSNVAAIELINGDVRNIYLNNFSIDGNKANQSSSNARGIYINGNTSLPVSTNPVETNDPRHIIKDIFIVNTKGVAFEIHGRGESQITGVEQVLGDSYGFVLDAFDNWYSNLSAGANKKTGVIISQNNCRIVNSKSWNNGQGGTPGDTDTHGFLITSGTIEGVVLTGCEAQANYNHGFSFVNARACIGVGLNSELNGQDPTLTGSGFHLNASRENNINGVCSNRTTLVQKYAITIEGFTRSNIIDVVSWSMATGNVNDLSGNKDQNELTIVDVASGEVKRYYRNAGSEFFRVNGSINTLALAPFHVLSTESANISGAVIQKAATTLNNLQELARWEIYDSANPSTLSRTRLMSRVDTGDIAFNTSGVSMLFNSANVNIGRIGTTAQRPISGLYQGMPYYDTTLAIPIYYGGSSIWRKYSDNTAV